MAIQSKIILILIISLFSSCKDDCIQDDDNTIKVLSWNIWHGGNHLGKNGPERIINLIKHSNADIITMQEGYGSQKKIADAVGCYLRAPSLKDKLWLYSR